MKAVLLYESGSVLVVGAERSDRGSSAGWMQLLRD